MTGSFDTRRNAISSGDVIGDVDYFISASNLYSRGYRDHSDQNNSRVFSNIGYRISDNLETRFYYTYANINQEIPGTLTKLQAEQTPKKAASSVLSGDNTRDYFQHRIANKTSYKSENFDLNGGVYTTQKDLYHPIFQVIDQQTSDYGAFSDVNIYSNLSGFKNETTLGANVQTGRTQALQFVNVLGTPRAETNNGLQKSDNLDLYFEDRFSLSDNFTLIAGGQGIYAQRNLGDFFLTDGDRSGETFYRGFSPKFGALYNINENISVFTNYSASYEPPTFSELTQSLPGVSGLADIEAQRSQTFEIGARGTLGKVSFDLSWYYAKLRDELMTYSTGITTTGVLNADDTIHEGIELGLNAMLAENVISNADNISSRLSYAHNNFRFDNDRQWNNNNIPGIPEDFIMFETRYNAPNEQFYIAPNIEYAVEGFAVGYANSLYTDNYMVFGLSAGYKLHKDVEIFADAKNLADKEYVATTGTITTPTSTNQAVFTPADGRSLFVGLTYKFN
jgi:iron complex outermembrane receptor protein